MKNSQVLISYSHADKYWKDRLITHLKVLGEEISLDVWDDLRVVAGDNWFEELQESLDQASVVILLISADFLTSSFALHEAIPRLLERRSKQGLAVIPVIVKPCAWQIVPWLREIQVRPSDGKPLGILPKLDVIRSWQNWRKR